MDAEEVVCPSCGAQLLPSEVGTGRCPRCHAVLGRAAAAPAPGEVEPLAGPVALRLSLWANVLKRLAIAPYAAARSWGESYALWVRVLVCLLPFCVGALASYCFWILLPPGPAYGWAVGVLVATVAAGIPTAVSFFPGSTAAGARRALEHLRARAQALRDEMIKGMEWRARQQMVAARKARQTAQQARAPEATAPPQMASEAPPPVPAAPRELPAPELGPVGLLPVAFQWIGWLLVAIALVVVIVRLAAGSWGMMTLPIVLGLGVGGLVLLAVGALAGLVTDTRRELWRMMRRLDGLQGEAEDAAPAEGEEGQ